MVASNPLSGAKRLNVNIPNHNRSAPSPCCNQDGAMTNASYQSRIMWFNRQYSYFVSRFLFEELVMSIGSFILWCVWHYSSTRNLCLNTRPRWIGKSFRLFPIDHTTTVWEPETCVQGMDWRIHNPTTIWKQIARLCGPVSRNTSATKPESIIHVVRILQTKRQVVQTNYRQPGLSGWPLQHGRNPPDGTAKIRKWTIPLRTTLSMDKHMYSEFSSKSSTS